MALYIVILYYRMTGFPKVNTITCQLFGGWNPVNTVITDNGPGGVGNVNGKVSKPDTIIFYRHIAAINQFNGSIIIHC